MKNSNTLITLTSNFTNPYLNRDGLLNRGKVELLQTKIVAALSNKLAPCRVTRESVTITKIHSRNRKQIVDSLLESGLIEAPREIKSSMTTKMKDGSFKLVLPKEMLFGEHTSLSISALLGSKFPTSPTAVFTIGKGKYEEFDAKKNKAGDSYAYLTRRCAPVKEQKKATAKSNVILYALPKGTLSEQMEKHMVAAVKAISVHTKSLDKIKARLKSAKEIVAEQRALDFDTAALEVLGLLESAGIDSKDSAISQGMMGKNMQVKLPGSGLIIAVSLSKLENFKKAKATTVPGDGDKTERPTESKKVKSTTKAKKKVVAKKKTK